MVSVPSATFGFGGYISSVPTVGVLRSTGVAVARSKGDTILVSGQLQAGDGNGGAYIWLPAALNDDDGIQFIKPTSVQDGTPGRWARAIGNDASGLSSLTQQFVDLKAEYDDPVHGVLALEASLSNEEVVRLQGDQALAQQIFDLSTSVSGQFLTSNAHFEQEIQTISDAESSLASRTTVLEADYSAQSGSINSLTSRVTSAEASISTEETARADGDSALASRTSNLEANYSTQSGQIGTLNSQMTTANAAISTEQTARANAVQAVADSVTNLSANFVTTIGNVNQSINNTNAAVSSESTARANADTALGQRIDSVSAGVAISGNNMVPDVPLWNYSDGFGYESHDANWGPLAQGANPPASEQTYATTEVSVAPGTTYTVSADLRCFGSTSAGYVWIDIAWRSSDGTFIGFSPRATLTASADFSNSRARSTFSVTQAAPSGAATALVRFCGNGANVVSIAGMRRPKLEVGSVATGYSLENQLVQTAATASQALTASATANGAVGTLTSTVNAHYGEYQANASSTGGAIAGLQGKTSAYWTLQADAGNGRAQLSVHADSYGNAGVDIVGDVSINGNLLVGGTITTGKLGLNAVTISYPSANPNSFPGNGSGTNYDTSVGPAAGGGGTFGCVAIESYMPDGGTAGEVQAGSPLTMLRSDDSGYFAGQATDASVITQPCYRLTTARGITVIASVTTPITTRGGEVVRIGQAGNVEIPVLDRGEFAWDRVSRLDYLGHREVAFISADDGTYAAGEIAGRYVFTHNKTTNGQ